MTLLPPHPDSIRYAIEVLCTHAPEQKNLDVAFSMLTAAELLINVLQYLKLPLQKQEN